MIKSFKKYPRGAVKFGIAFTAVLSLLFAIPTAAEEVTGTLTTGVGSGGGGVNGMVIAAPTASVAAGTYTSNQSVTLSASGSSSIHYTTSGTDPTCSTGTAISSGGTVSVTTSTTIEAISCYPNSQASTVASFAYTLACVAVSNAATYNAYPTCGPATCNSGYTVSGSTCVADGGGGGGGGGGYVSTAPTITAFTANPLTITAGQAVTLSWNVSNATSLSVNQGVGALPNTATGSRTVYPAVTTTYTLTISNAAGATATATATVTVPGTVPAPVTPPGQQQAAPVGVHPNGTLVLDGQTVYLIRDGKRFGFRNPDEYKSHGYNFGQVVTASDSDKALPMEPTGIVKALEGTLVLDASDNRTVYMIGMNGTKRGFTTEAVFGALGYSFKNLPKIDLADYPAGPAIGSETEAHPEGALILEGQTVWWVRNNQRQGFESEAVFNTYGFSFAKVVPANAADLLLPVGSLVKFRDGTLVKDGADYYLISDGKKLKFSSETDLTGRGYKTANAISATLTTYEAGGVIQ